MRGHFISEMVDKLRSRGLITETERPEVQDTLEDYWHDKIAMVWTVEEIQDHDPSLSEDQALGVLDSMLNRTHKTVGVNWDRVDDLITLEKELS